MAKQGQTGIVWTDETWNPVTGCTKVSQGCKHCYAERDWHRLQHLPRFAGRAFTDVVCHPERLDQPLRWAKPRRIFVNSMSDLFHEDATALSKEFVIPFQRAYRFIRGETRKSAGGPIQNGSLRSNANRNSAAGRLLDGVQHDGYPA